MHNGKLQLEKRPIELGCGVPKGHKRRLLQTLHSSRFANPFFFVYSLAMAVVTCATATSTCAFASASPSSPTRAKPHAFRSFAACAPPAGVAWRPLGPTRVVELKDGELTDYEFELEHVGLAPVDRAAIAGGEPGDNARIIQAILDGDTDAPRTVVVLNAAAALLAADRADDWPAAVSLAEDTIDSGAAAAALERLRISTSG